MYPDDHETSTASKEHVAHMYDLSVATTPTPPGVLVDLAGDGIESPWYLQTGKENGIGLQEKLQDPPNIWWYMVKPMVCCRFPLRPIQ